MPIYDFQCKVCAKRSELLVMPGEVPTCPKCGSTDLQMMFSSTAAVSTTRSRERAMKGARSRAGAEKKEKDHAHAEYLRNHEKDHS